MYFAQYLRVPQWCSTAEAYFVSVSTVVLSVRRIVVEVHVEAVVNMAMTPFLFQDYKSLNVKENRAGCA